MIERIDEDTFCLYCDECEEEADCQFDTFAEAVDFKKDNGWKSIKNRATGAWSEVCPECAAQPGVYKKFAGITSR